MVRERVRMSVLAIALIFVGFAMAGCLGQQTDDGDVQRAEGETGNMAVFVKDLPDGGLDSLVVTFGEVRAVTAASGTTGSSETPGEPTRTAPLQYGPDDAQGRQTAEDGAADPLDAPDEDVGQEIPAPENTTVTPSPQTVTPNATDAPVDMSAEARTLFRFSTEVDLAEVEGPRESELLGIGGLEPGSYEHVVVEIQEARATFANMSEPQELNITSEFLVVSGDFDVREGETTQVLIDFDLNASVTRETVTNATTPPDDVPGNATGGATEDPMTQNGTADDDDWAFQPRLRSVWLAHSADEEDDERFAFDTGGEIDAAAFAAASADVRGGLLVLGDVTIVRMASVQTHVGIDLNGDGRANRNVTGPLDTEVERLREAEPRLTEDLLAEDRDGGLTGGAGTGTPGGPPADDRRLPLP